MRKTLLSLAAMALVGCAGTSYGVSPNGIFPPRPAGAEYPNWEHMCVVFDPSNATTVLNKAGDQGFELVAVGTQGGDSLMCFKRPTRSG